MNNRSPVMLLRARPKPDAASRFAKWFRAVHLADVGRIPGVSAVQGGHTPGGTWFGFYTFEDSEQMQAALQSAEAAYARGTWEQWAPHLEELSIEVLAPVGPLPIFNSRN
jgi:hypothetical protein